MIRLDKFEMNRLVEFFNENHSLIEGNIFLELKEESDGHVTAKIGDIEEDLTLYT